MEHPEKVKRFFGFFSFWVLALSGSTREEGCNGKSERRSGVSEDKLPPAFLKKQGTAMAPGTSQLLAIYQGPQITPPVQGPDAAVSFHKFHMVP
jgi:hypothetical protein